MSGILNEHPNLAAYAARGEARPAYKRTYDALAAAFAAAPPPFRLGRTIRMAQLVAVSFHNRSHIARPEVNSLIINLGG